MTSTVDGVFISEIECMMYALGDCKRPLAESAKTIEDIAHRQLSSMIRRASGSSSSLTPEQLLFLIRKDHSLLFRLIRHMKLKDSRTQANKAVAIASGDVNDDLWQEDAESYSSIKSASAGPGGGKRFGLLQQFLQNIDVSGDLASLLDGDISQDTIKYERAVRAAAQARSMDAGEYLRFAEARQVSFCPNNKLQNRKFHDWLFPGVAAHSTNAMVLEILNFLAYEIVASLMDCALLIKREMSSRLRPPMSAATDPLIRLKSVDGRPRPARASALGGSPYPSSQHTPLILAQRLRERCAREGKLLPDDLGLDSLRGLQVQPEHIREAYRRLEMYGYSGLFSM